MPSAGKAKAVDIKFDFDDIDTASTTWPTCLDASLGWHEISGAAYKCAWYAEYVLNSCNDFGNHDANCDGPDGEDWTLDNGSCPTTNIVGFVCGGGQSTIDDDTDAPTSSPVASGQTGSPTCSHHPPTHTDRLSH
jgi:hypothetical protein